MKQRPLFFSFSELVPGRDFVASVRLVGQVLLVEEEDGWGLYGVCPGGISGGGATRDEAHADFMRTLLGALLDLAEEAKGFRAFEKSLRASLWQVNAPNLRDWKAAVKEVRQRRAGFEWAPGKPLARIDADVQKARLKVALLPANALPPEPAAPVFQAAA